MVEAVASALTTLIILPPASGVQQVSLLRYRELLLSMPAEEEALKTTSYITTQEQTTPVMVVQVLEPEIQE